jgi:hypothetical protein
VVTTVKARLNGHQIFIAGVCPHGRRWPEVKAELRTQLARLSQRNGSRPRLPGTCNCCHGPRPCAACERKDIGQCIA